MATAIPCITKQYYLVELYNLHLYTRFKVEKTVIYHLCVIIVIYSGTTIWRQCISVLSVFHSGSTTLGALLGEDGSDGRRSVPSECEVVSAGVIQSYQWRWKIGS